MSKVMIRVHNIETGEIVDREATPEELAQIKNDADEQKTLDTAQELKEVTKQELLNRLGITAEEAKLLLS